MCGGTYRALAWASDAAFRLVFVCAYKRTRSMRIYTSMCKGICTYLVYTLYAMKLLDCLCRRRTRRGVQLSLSCRCYRYCSCCT
uniref:Secreted protein n=1 Tax=Trichogramma kaykai TaxID=54128 RepID=A0ABD2XGM1_9HYME